MTNQVIYIPEYVEQGLAKLLQAKNILVQIESCINSGIATVNASGYNRGIPHIEKGNNESSELSSLESTIDTITSEIQRYSNGEALELESAIIIADPNTIEKYGLKKEDIDYTLSDYILKSDNVAANPTIQGKWESGYLTGPAGFIKYTGADGRLTKETWCDLNPNNLARLMREDHGIELDYWIREDGVYMYGDYVMVAADIPHMDGTEQAAQYRKGDLVQTSLGTGMVVDLCGKAEQTRKGQTDVDVWYDIYTAWHGSYSHVGYCSEEGCTHKSHTEPKTTMIRKAENPTTINPRTGQPISSGFVFNNNSTNNNSGTNNSGTVIPDTGATETVGNPNTQSGNVFDTNTTNNPNESATNPPNTNTTYTPNTGSTYTPSTGSTYTPSTGSTYTPSTGSTYTPSTGSTYTPSTGSTYTPSTGSTYTPSTGSSNTTSYPSSSTPSTGNVSSIYNVNGFSKPVTSTPEATPPVVNNPVVSTPVVNTPVVNTPPVSTPPVSEIPTVGFEDVLTPEVDVNDTSEIIISKPVDTPIEMPDLEINSEIVDNNTQVENIPMSTPDTPIENSNNNNIPLIATLVGAGALAAGVGAKIIHDKRKESHDNGEDDEFSSEE